MWPQGPAGEAQSPRQGPDPWTPSPSASSQERSRTGGKQAIPSSDLDPLPLVTVSRSVGGHPETHGRCTAGSGILDPVHKRIHKGSRAAALTHCPVSLLLCLAQTLTPRLRTSPTVCTHGKPPPTPSGSQQNPLRQARAAPPRERHLTAPRPRRRAQGHAHL